MNAFERIDNGGKIEYNIPKRYLLIVVTEIFCSFDILKRAFLRAIVVICHVETLVCLSKKSEKHISIDVEFGESDGQISLKKLQKELNEQKLKKKTTYKDIQKWVEENYGFKVHTAYIAEVKRDLGLPMYDAPNAVEELKRPRSHPTEQMTTAIKAALKHFEII